VTEASFSCNNHFAMATCEHANSALSSTCLQSIGGGGRPGEPDRSRLTVTPHVTKTLIKVISNELGANAVLNPRVEFKN
jgi:hypothetical protein